MVAAWGATSEVSLPMRILETVPLWPYPIGPVRSKVKTSLGLKFEILEFTQYQMTDISIYFFPRFCAPNHTTKKLPDIHRVDFSKPDSSQGPSWTSSWRRPFLHMRVSGNGYTLLFNGGCGDQPEELGVPYFQANPYILEISMNKCRFNW